MVFFDKKITRYLLRDCDAKLSSRDASAVNEWINDNSNQSLYFHVMRDHPRHRHTILGGMWGSLGGYINADSPKLFESMKDQIEAGQIRYGGDQEWLRKVIWPNVRNSTLAHDEFFCKHFESLVVRGFPHKRIDGTDFVGNVYTRPKWRGLVMKPGSSNKECLRNASFYF